MSVSELRASDIKRTARLVGRTAPMDRMIDRLTSGIVASVRAEYDHSVRRGGFIGHIDAEHTIDAGHAARVEGGRRQSAEATVCESLDSPGAIGSIAATRVTLEEHFPFDPFLGFAAECNPGRTAV
ncbi:hypothetical protein [Streptomyces sp. DASNCL29]|uniref:hypothetical protein n=1 Tax=Streptomyces sp. DASNCL29 TaxID=2583819 RepID=UPI00110F9891|nr:hypothetical protein [Streptomyces sp. DASNCL29]TMU99316.1 hypothetical protein FGK60_17260 [Streptomyces sp. DASNCL29]